MVHQTKPQSSRKPAGYKKRKRKMKKKGSSQKPPLESENIPTVFDFSGGHRKMFSHHLPITVRPPSNGDTSVVTRMLSKPTFSCGSGRRGCRRNRKAPIQPEKRRRGRPKKCPLVDSTMMPEPSKCLGGVANNMPEEGKDTSVTRKLSFAEVELLASFVYNARRPRKEAVVKNSPLKLSVRLAKPEGIGRGSKNVISEKTSLWDSREGCWKCFHVPSVSRDFGIENMPQSEDSVCQDDAPRGRTRKRRHVATNLFRSVSTGGTGKRKLRKEGENENNGDLPSKAVTTSESNNCSCSAESPVAVPVVDASSGVPTSKGNRPLRIAKKEQNIGDCTVEGGDLSYRKRFEDRPMCTTDAEPQSTEPTVESVVSPVTIKRDSMCGKVKLVLSKNTFPKESKKQVERDEPQTAEDWYCQEVNFTGIRLKRENRKSSEGETDAETARKPKKLKRSSSLLKDAKKCRPCSVALVDFVKCLNLGMFSSPPGHHSLQSVSCTSPDWKCNLKSIEHLETMVPITPIRMSTLPQKIGPDSGLEVIDLTYPVRDDVGNQKENELASTQFLSSSGFSSQIFEPVHMNYFPSRFSVELIPSTEEHYQQEIGSLCSSDYPAWCLDNDEGLEDLAKGHVYDRSQDKSADETKSKGGSDLQMMLQLPKLKKIIDSVVKASKSVTAQSGVDGAWKEKDTGCAGIIVGGCTSSSRDSSTAQDIVFQPLTPEERIDSTSIVSPGGASHPLASEGSITPEFTVRTRRSKAELGAALHTCVHCIFSTPNRVSMREHIYIHTDIIPFMCGLCGALFGTQSAANLHSKRDHPGKDRQIIKDSTINAEDHYTTEYAAKIVDCKEPKIDVEESKINAGEPKISKASSCHDPDVQNLVAVECLTSENSDDKSFPCKNCLQNTKTLESIEVDHFFKDLTKGNNLKDYAAPIIHNDCKVNLADDPQKRRNNAIDVNDCTSKDKVYQVQTKTDPVLLDRVEKCTVDDNISVNSRPSSAKGSTARNTSARRPGTKCRTRKDLATSERSTTSGDLPVNNSARSQNCSASTPAGYSEQSLANDGSRSGLPSSTSTQSTGPPLSTVGEISVVTCRTASDASELNRRLLSPKSSASDNEQRRCSTSSRRYSCLHCDYSTPEIADVENHVFVMHPRMKRLVCPICTSYFCKWKPTMLSHFSTLHPKVKPVLVYEPSYLQKEDVDSAKNKRGKNSVAVPHSLKSQKRSPKRSQVQKSQSVSATMSLRRSGRQSLTPKLSGSPKSAAKPGVIVFGPALGVSSIECQLKVPETQPTLWSSDVADENINSIPGAPEDLKEVKTLKDEPVDNGCTNGNLEESISNGCIKTDPDVMQLQQPMPVFGKSEEGPSGSLTPSLSNRVVGTVSFYETSKSTQERNFVPSYLSDEKPTLDLDSLVSFENSETRRDTPLVQNDSGEAVGDVPSNKTDSNSRTLTEDILICGSKFSQASLPSACHESSSSSGMTGSDRPCGKIMDPGDIERIFAETGSENSDFGTKFFDVRTVYLHDSEVKSSVVNPETVVKDEAACKDMDHSRIISTSTSSEPGESLCSNTNISAVSNDEFDCSGADSRKDVPARQTEFQEYSGLIDSSANTIGCVFAIGCIEFAHDNFSTEIPVSSDAGNEEDFYSKIISPSDVSNVSCETEEKILIGDGCKSGGEDDESTSCGTTGRVTDGSDDGKGSVESVEAIQVAVVGETDTLDDLDCTRRDEVAVVCTNGFYEQSIEVTAAEQDDRNSEVNKIELYCAAKDSVSTARSENDSDTMKTANSGCAAKDTVSIVWPKNDSNAAQTVNSWPDCVASESASILRCENDSNATQTVDFKSDCVASYFTSIMRCENDSNGTQTVESKPDCLASDSASIMRCENDSNGTQSVESKPDCPTSDSASILRCENDSNGTQIVDSRSDFVASDSPGTMRCENDSNGTQIVDSRSDFVASESAITVRCENDSSGTQTVDSRPDCVLKEPASCVWSENYSSASQTLTSKFENSSEEYKSNSGSVNDIFVMSPSVENACKELCDEDSCETDEKSMHPDGEYVLNENRPDRNCALEGDLVGAVAESASLHVVHINKALEADEIQSSKADVFGTEVVGVFGTDIESIVVEGSTKTFELPEVCDEQESDCCEFKTNVETESIRNSVIKDTAETLAAFSPDSIPRASCVTEETGSVAGTVEKATEFSCCLETLEREVSGTDVTATNETEEQTVGRGDSCIQGNEQLLTQDLPKGGQAQEDMYEKVGAGGLDEAVENGEVSDMAVQSGVSSAVLDVSDMAADSDGALGYVAMDSKEALDSILANICDDEAVNTAAVDLEKASDSVNASECHYKDIGTVVADSEKASVSVIASECDDEAVNTPAVDLEKASAIVIDSECEDKPIGTVVVDSEKISDSVSASECNDEAIDTVAVDSEMALDSVIAIECNDEAVNTPAVDLEKATDSVIASECDDEVTDTVVVDSEKASVSVIVNTPAVDLEKATDSVIVNECNDEAIDTVVVDSEKALDSVIAIECNDEAVDTQAVDLATDSVIASECDDVDTVVVDSKRASVSVIASECDEAIDTVVVDSEQASYIANASECDREAIGSVIVDSEQASDSVNASECNDEAIDSVVVDSEKVSVSVIASECDDEAIGTLVVDSEQASYIANASECDDEAMGTVIGDSEQASDKVNASEFNDEAIDTVVVDSEKVSVSVIASECENEAIGTVVVDSEQASDSVNASACDHEAIGTVIVDSEQASDRVNASECNDEAIGTAVVDSEQASDSVNASACDHEAIDTVVVDSEQASDIVIASECHHEAIGTAAVDSEQASDSVNARACNDEGVGNFSIDSGKALDSVTASECNDEVFSIVGVDFEKGLHSVIASEYNNEAVGTVAVDSEKALVSVSASECNDEAVDTVVVDSEKALDSVIASECEDEAVNTPAVNLEKDSDIVIASECEDEAIGAVAVDSEKVSVSVKASECDYEAVNTPSVDLEKASDIVIASECDEAIGAVAVDSEKVSDSVSVCNDEDIGTVAVDSEKASVNVNASEGDEIIGTVVLDLVKASDSVIASECDDEAIDTVVVDSEKASDSVNASVCNDEAVGKVAVDSKKALDSVTASECNDEVVGTVVIDFEKLLHSVIAREYTNEAVGSVAVDFENAPDSMLAGACNDEALNSGVDDAEKASDGIVGSVCDDGAISHVDAVLGKTSDICTDYDDGDINSVVVDTEKAVQSIAASAWADEAIDSLAVGSETVLASIATSACREKGLNAVADCEKAFDSINAVECNTCAGGSSVAVRSQTFSDATGKSKTSSQLVDEFQFNHTLHTGESSEGFPAGTGILPDAIDQDQESSNVLTRQRNCFSENEHNDLQLSELVIDEKSDVESSIEQNVQEGLPASAESVKCKEAFDSAHDSERSSQVVATSTVTVPTVISGGQTVQEYSLDSADFNKAFDIVNDFGHTSLGTVLSSGLNIQQESLVIFDLAQCSNAVDAVQDSRQCSQSITAPAPVPTVLAEPESTSLTTSQNLSEESRRDHIRKEEAVSTSVRSEDCMCLEVSSTSDDPTAGLPEVPALGVVPANEGAVPASDFATDEELDVETYTEEEPEKTGVEKELEKPCGHKETSPREAVCQYCSFDCASKEKMMQHVQQFHKMEFANSTQQNSTVQGVGAELSGSRVATKSTDQGDDLRTVNVIVIEPNNNFDRVERKRRRSLSTDDSDSLQPEPVKHPCRVAAPSDEDEDDVIFVREEKRPLAVSHSSRSSSASNTRLSDAGLTKPDAAVPCSSFVMSQADASVGAESVARRHPGFMAPEKDARRVRGQNAVLQEQSGLHQSNLTEMSCRIPDMDALYRLRDRLEPLLSDASLVRSLETATSSQWTSNPVNYALVTRAICRPIMSTMTLDPAPAQHQANTAMCLVGRQMQQPVADSGNHGNADSRAGPVSVAVTTASDTCDRNTHRPMAARVAGPPPLMHISELQTQTLGNLRFYPDAVVQNPGDHISRNPPTGSRLIDNRADFGQRPLVNNWSNLPERQPAHNARAPADVQEFARLLPSNRGDATRPPSDVQGDYTARPLAHSGSFFTRPLDDNRANRATRHVADNLSNFQTGPLVDSRADHVTQHLADNRGKFATVSLVDNRTDHVTKHLADNRGKSATRSLVDNPADHLTRQLSDSRGDFALLVDNRGNHNRGDLTAGRSMVPPPAHSKLPVRQLPIHGPSFLPTNTQPRPAGPNTDNARIPYDLYSALPVHTNRYSAHLQASNSGGIFQGAMRSEKPLPAHLPQRSQALISTNIPHAHQYLRPSHGAFEPPHVRHLEAAASSTNSCLLCSFQASDKWSLYNHILTHSLSDHGN